MMNSTDMDREYMQNALELAAKAVGRTNPNPAVGAVIVKDGHVVGEGFHKKAGTPHAEIHALNMAGENARGSTVYVTLEPCSHYGKTPPCADALISAGVERVVIATQDPNPRVAGRGIKKLKDAGIDIVTGVLETEAQRLNEVFFKYIQNNMPFVALKTAMTLDGKIATYTGDSKWISNELSRHYVHELRNIYDAILVGIGTVIKDDPMLNTRLDYADKKDPIRVIIDGNLEIPINSKIVKTSKNQRTIVFCAAGNNTEKCELLRLHNIQIIELGEDPANIPLDKVLQILGSMEICSLLVEGGGEINASFIQNRLIDKVYWFISPKILGGRQAPSPIGGQGVRYMDQAVKLNFIELNYFGEDICISGYM